MIRTPLIFLSCLFIIYLVSMSEYQHRTKFQELNKSFNTVLKDLESAEKTIESMHRTHNFIVQEYQKDLEAVRHELQMPSWYFLENLAKRLEENDQCNVVITTVGR